MRRIVVLRSAEWLSKAFQHKASAETPDVLHLNLKVPGGIKIQTAIYPVRVPLGKFRPVEAADPSAVEYRGDRGDEYVVAAEVEDERAAQAFQEENREYVVGTYSDPEIQIFGVVCPNSAVGTDADVKNKLNLSKLHGDGNKGTGVKIIVVDTGIDGTQINVSDGWSPWPGVYPGGAAAHHGTMVAYDARLAAPDAAIWDIPLLQSKGGTWLAFLSDAIRAFSEIMIKHLQVPGPKVTVNSWGMYDTTQDAAVGNPQNYSRNPNHPFNQITGALVGSGVDVVFACGNCGSTCSSKKCGSGNIGPANSIHGANSHPDIVSVAAVTVKDDLLGYSSEGPGGLSAQTPDISGFSHFKGSGVYPIDTGTSAACPVIGGVLAALRSSPKGRNLTPLDLKQRLLNSARSVHGPGWSPQYGWGIVDADAAYQAL